MRRLIFLATLVLSFSLFGQNGTIRGKVLDGATGETVIGASVLVLEHNKGMATDLDGNFSISMPAGSYDLKISAVMYAQIVIKGIEVKANEVTVLPDIVLKDDSELEVITVEAEAIKGGEINLQLEKMNAITSKDGISKELMNLTGDGDAASAAKRVTGVSVEGGKYVYVRGLGDRYTKTTLNGLEIPGLDPDRNSLQLDMFPSSLIENLVVSKNFTASNTADYTGGLVNIETVGFPEKKFSNISFSLGYNPDMHFNKNYLTYKGSATDYLGFDGGARQIPSAALGSAPPSPLTGASSSQVTDFVKSFSPVLGAERRMSGMDFGISYSMGDQIEMGKKKEKNKGKQLGYIFSASYKVNYKYYSEVENSEYIKNIDPTIYEMEYATKNIGEIGQRNVTLGLLGGLAVKTKLSKYRFTLMHLQNSQSTAGKFDIDNNGNAIGQSGYIAYSDNLEYNQRGLTNLLIAGEHVKDTTGWEFNWGFSPTFSLSKDPDIRKTAFTVGSTVTQFAAGGGGLPARIWRSLNEINAPARFDVTKKYKMFKRDTKLRFGASYSYKRRGYEILQYNMQFWFPQSWANNPETGKPEQSDVLSDANIYPNNPNGIYYQTGITRPNPNEYQSSVHYSGLYVNNEFPFAKVFKAVLGVRIEHYLQTHTGRDQKYAAGDKINGKNLDNDIVLNDIDLFPEVNLIVTLKSKKNENITTNFRGGYSMSIARPSFKELSYAQIIDPITQRIFTGGLFAFNDWDGNLRSTRIHNADLRWETYFSRGQIITASVFYKNFDAPIELVRIPQQTSTTEYQPRNVGGAWLMGFEFEFRKNLSFIHKSLENLSVIGNLTMVKSVVEMTDAEFNNRKLYEKPEEGLAPRRQMAGQAPWLINAGITYTNKKVGKNKEKYLGIDVGIFYNVKGPTLFIVGSGIFPDIYTDPYHSLNFSFSLAFGKNQNTSIDFSASNLIGDNIYRYYSSFEAENQTFSSMNPGRTFTLGFKYKFK
ncbi:MAG: carboxypeptidase-like regulatory domain-containing protein [Crocinitomicaceae bacterium]